MSGWLDALNGRERIHLGAAMEVLDLLGGDGLPIASGEVRVARGAVVLSRSHCHGADEHFATAYEWQWRGTGSDV